MLPADVVDITSSAGSLASSITAPTMNSATPPLSHRRTWMTSPAAAPNRPADVALRITWPSASTRPMGLP